jgi:hypothetical protein
MLTLVEAVFEHLELIKIFHDMVALYPPLDRQRSNNTVSRRSRYTVLVLKSSRGRMALRYKNYLLVLPIKLVMNKNGQEVLLVGC